MASIIKNWVLPNFSLNSDYKHRSRVRCLGAEDSAVVSPDSLRVNGVSFVGEKERSGSLINVGNGGLSSGIEEKKPEENVLKNKLEPLWEDGYGAQNLKDYNDSGRDMIKLDGGLPRWFCPVACGCPLKDSPVLLFLPGKRSLGAGFELQIGLLQMVHLYACWFCGVPFFCVI